MLERREQSSHGTLDMCTYRAVKGDHKPTKSFLAPADDIALKRQTRLK